MEAKNSLELSGQIIKIYPIKHTPIGLPVLSFVLEHSSIMMEGGLNRKVKCNIYCIMIDKKFSEVDLYKKNVVIQGFLSQNTKMQLVLYVNEINIFG